MGPYFEAAHCSGSVPNAQAEQSVTALGNRRRKQPGRPDDPTFQSPSQPKKQPRGAIQPQLPRLGVRNHCAPLGIGRGRNAGSGPTTSGRHEKGKCLSPGADHGDVLVLTPLVSPKLVNCLNLGSFAPNKSVAPSTRPRLIGVATQESNSPAHGWFTLSALPVQAVE